jgi:hypothetical protein
LELLQVDKPPPAPHFKLVARPNEWRATVSRSTVSPRQQAYEAFFSELLDKVKARHPNLTRAKRAYSQNWFSYPVGRAGFAVNTAFGQGDQFRVGLYIDVGDRSQNEAAFDALSEDREAIEAKIGQPIVWQRLDDKRASRIYCSTNGSIDDDPARLEELQDWAIDLVAMFYKVFKPRVQKLKL